MSNILQRDKPNILLRYYLDLNNTLKGIHKLKFNNKCIIKFTLKDYIRYYLIYY